MPRRLATKGTHRAAKSVKGWSRAAPRRVPQKLRLFRRCGRGAFLAFNKHDPAASGFPIVAARGGCKPDCRGLRAAYARARQFGRSRIASAAKRRAVSAGCSWAGDRHRKRRRR